MNPFNAAKWGGEDCERCGGAGEFENTTLSEPLNPIVMEDCPDCKGTGKVPYLDGLWTPERGQGVGICRGKLVAHYNSEMLSSDCLPLLPSPVGLTREVAIAALELAGFADVGHNPTTPSLLEIEIKEGFAITINTGDGAVSYSIFPNYDIKTGRHLLNCADKIKQWCDAVNWDAV